MPLAFSAPNNSSFIELLIAAGGVGVMVGVHLVEGPSAVGHVGCLDPGKGQSCVRGSVVYHATSLE
jgi:hypothetical protein